MITNRYISSRRIRLSQESTSSQTRPRLLPRADQSCPQKASPTCVSRYCYPWQHQERSKHYMASSGHRWRTQLAMEMLGLTLPLPRPAATVGSSLSTSSPALLSQLRRYHPRSGDLSGQLACYVKREYVGASYQRALRDAPSAPVDFPILQYTWRYRPVNHLYLYDATTRVVWQDIPFGRLALLLNLSEDTLGLVTYTVGACRQFAITLDLLLPTHVAGL